MEPDNTLAFSDLPAFPDNVPTAPLLRLSLQKLFDNDAAEEDRLWRACCDLGFFYLDLRSANQPSKRDSFTSSTNGDESAISGDALLDDADALFHLGNQVFDLPIEEKQKYDFKPRGSYFGYKALGHGIVDAKGTKDRNEFYNVSKDDLLDLGEGLEAPACLRKEENRELLKRYVRRSHGIADMILGMLNSRLELPEGKLEGLHRLQARSGDVVRWVRSPPQPMDDAQLALGQHTDFGSVTILFNRLGGLQIPTRSSWDIPGGEEWCYVRPLRGHCVVNLGDALVKFTAGVLRSNMHRVVDPPGDQAGETRMSLVYFARPEDEVLLKALEGSEMVRERRQGVEEEEEITAKDWILRRAMGSRKGGDYAGSRGTEGVKAKS